MYYILKFLKLHFLKMQPQVFDTKADVNLSRRSCVSDPISLFMIAEGDSSSSFLRPKLIQYYQARRITLLKTVMLHQ